jgi:hypothetical protein
LIAQEALAERLEAFLAGHGATREMLEAAVHEPFGTPLLVVAAGSVLHGFGNQRSDIDINIVVERDVVRVPITSYLQRILLDTKFFGAFEVQSWVGAIRDHPWPPIGRLDRPQWERRHGDLTNCVRFAYGLVLNAQDGWHDWLAECRKPWLVTRVAQWWRTESVRRQLAARWLADAKPLLAAQRALEAVLAALESRAAAAGQLYYGPKWLSEKLRVLGDASAMAAMRAVMRSPTDERDARNCAARCEALLDEFRGGPEAGLVAQLSYLRGVNVRALDARTLVTRWNLRGLELRGAIPEPSESLDPIWEGGLDTRPPDDVLALFLEDMLWLSIVTTRS